MVKQRAGINITEELGIKTSTVAWVHLPAIMPHWAAYAIAVFKSINKRGS